MKIRFVTQNDSNALLNIYAQYINTPITFEYNLPDINEFSERIENISSDYPYLVYEENKTILGYAYAHRHMERPAYQWNVELSVYLDANAQSRGIGQKMYEAIIGILQLQQIKTVYAGITSPNVKSEKLHLRTGFKLIGIYHNAGFKCGKWHDVMWFEKEIAPHGHSPESVIPISRLNTQLLESVLTG